ncbi:MAG: hypothetical protein ACLQBB_07975 [Solirubrobacteraceae bacterium]
MTARTEASRGVKPPEDSAQPVDWGTWHSSYERAGSALGRRLELVRGELRAALDRARAGPLTAISVCAGQGHDLLGVLADHPRREDVRARLVELDPGNVLAACRAAAAAGLGGVEIVEGDASLTDAYAGTVPADLILLCGVFGNISARDVERTIEELPSLCAAGASVVWTRHRNPPDLVPRILSTFERAGFEHVALRDGPHLAVGRSRLATEPSRFRAGIKMFEFIGQGALWPHLSADDRGALAALFRPDCSLIELVAAIRALPAGGDTRQTVESMLREGRGTSATKHAFLAQELARRFPKTEAATVHRVYRLTRPAAVLAFGPGVAAAVPSDGLVDIHRYLEVSLGGTRVSLDATTIGPRWDGRSRLGPACAAGRDYRVEGDADLELRELERRHCDEHARAPFLAALAVAGIPPAPD